MKKIILFLFILFFTISCSRDSNLLSKTKEISPEKKSLLAYGAILSSRNAMDFSGLGFYEKGVEVSKLYKADTISLLKESWEVSDRKTAIETLDWLVIDGHRKTWDSYLYNLQEGGTEKYDGYEKDKARYDKCVKMLKEKFNINDDILKKVDMGAWDYDRLVTVSRWCYIAGYITEEEAWNYCITAKKLAQASFSSWEEYYASCVFGRSIAYEGDPDELLEAGQELLKKDNSIWKEIPFKSNN